MLRYSQILSFRMSAAQTNSEILPVPNTGMTARTYSKIEFEFDFALYKLG